MVAARPAAGACSRHNTGPLAAWQSHSLASGRRGHFCKHSLPAQMNGDASRTRRRHSRSLPRVRHRQVVSDFTEPLTGTHDGSSVKDGVSRWHEAAREHDITIETMSRNSLRLAADRVTADADAAAT